MKTEKYLPGTCHQIDCKGHQLVVKGYGENNQGLPIFMVHGLTGSIDIFSDLNIQEFNELGPVYCASLPGHYPSLLLDDYTGPCSEKELADTLAVQIQAISPEQPVILYGHSTGATAAIAAALFYPECVKALIICEGSHHGRESEGIFALLQKCVREYGIFGTMLFKSLFMLSGSHKWVHSFFLRDLFADPKNAHRFPQMRQTIDKYWYNLKRLNLDWMKKIFADLYDVDLTDRLHQINCPTLILVGEKDPYVPLEIASTQLNKIPDAQMHVFKNGGHVPFFEHFQEYFTVCKQWIKQINKSGSNLQQPF